MKLSIVTITYNDPQGLEKTLNSLKPLFNSGIDWEHIIIDSSPEKNEKLIDAKSSRHFVVDPAGVYKALNYGIEKSLGDYIWFLNGGDLLFSVENVKSAIDFLSSNQQIELLLCGVQLERDGKKLYQKVPHKDLICNILGSNFLCHQGVIYKKTVFQKAGFFNTDYKIASDYEHYFKCYLTKINTTNFGCPIGTFDVSGSSSNQMQALQEFKLIQGQLVPRLPLWVNGLNKIFYNLFFLRVLLFQNLKKSILGPHLYKVWLLIKRRG